MSRPDATEVLRSNDDSAALRGAGAAWPSLRDLQVGDVVPASLYVLDYADGTRPRWTVVELEEFPTGGRRLVLEDPDNSVGGRCARVNVLAWPTKTLRSPAYRAGSTPGPTLCDMDQQGRRDAA